MKQVIILAGLLGVALTASYLTWTADESPDRNAEKVVVYRAAADDLESVTWSTDKETSTVSRKRDGKGPYVWVDLTETFDVPVTPKVEDGPLGPDAMGIENEPETVTETETASFKGNKAADAMWEDLAPMYALRELEVSGSSDTAFGFDHPQATVEIKRRSGPLTLLIGGETYGGKDRYVKMGERVFLIDDKVLRPLQFAKTRLVDRMLHPVADTDADSVVVRSEGREVTLIHGNKDDRTASFWATSEAPTEADGAAEAWLQKLMRMRVQVYDVAADLTTMQPVFDFTVKAGSENWTVRVLRHDGEETKFYAVSDYTRAPVELTESLASEAIADLDSLLPPLE